MNDKVEYLIKLAPLIQEAMPFESMIGVTDTQKFLYYLPSKNLNLGDVTGQDIPEQDIIYKAIHSKKTQINVVPREAFGIPFKAKGIPIKDDLGNIIGGLGIGFSLENQEKLSQMAEHITSTTEEISASTQVLASAALELSTFLESINKSQLEMNEQVNKTEKMLAFINEIARSSRILGLNAGIEAARSGVHGKGFGIVAQEITKLADSSAKSVGEISELIALLKEKVNDVAEIVLETVQVAQQQSTSSEEIAEAIQQLAVTAEDFEDLAKIL